MSLGFFIGGAVIILMLAVAVFFDYWNRKNREWGENE